MGTSAMDLQEARRTLGLAYLKGARNLRLDAGERYRVIEARIRVQTWRTFPGREAHLAGRKLLRAARRQFRHDLRRLRGLFHG